MEIRNFVIIAHIDSGKSTLADRFLEMTGTVAARRMRPQYLDQLDLERERGITIKMAPVRMLYSVNKKDYIYNLIDTPGHSDFSYEVSRALAAVEGGILLVDGTKGIQAQTISNLRAARKAGLAIVGAVNKIDLDLPNLEKTVDALAELLGVSRDAVYRVSAKTGEGVKEILDAVAKTLPKPPDRTSQGTQALIFDSLYDEHKGIVAYARVFGGNIAPGADVTLLSNGAVFRAKEVGYFAPELKSLPSLDEGGIGYIATGLKEPNLVKIGDTLTRNDDPAGPRAGYREPGSVVFISFYPDGATEFDDVLRSFEELRLSDPALSLEPEASDALGRGIKVGFLGQLHFEITASRLRDEYGLDFLTSFPSVAYRIVEAGKERIVKQAKDFPDKADVVYQPMIYVEILTPSAYMSEVLSLNQVYDFEIGDIKNFGDNLLITATMPLAELLRDFDDKLKSVSSGYASFTYELSGEVPGEVEKIEILIAGEVVSALTRIVPRADLEREGRQSVERLKKFLPRQQFVQSIQAKARGRIIARETVPALRKDVTGYLYGGDRSRKMKLWKKQRRGKEKLKAMARVRLSPEIFREILKK